MVRYRFGGVSATMGYLPAALRNYLVRLGWAHGDDEVFSTEQADRNGLISTVMGKSAARFDFAEAGEPQRGLHSCANPRTRHLVELIVPRLVRRMVGRDRWAMMIKCPAAQAGMEGLQAAYEDT